MSKYTMQLRHVISFYSRNDVEGWFKDYELSDYLTQDEIDVIEERGTWSKEKLAKQIVDTYLMREIGFETPFLFKHYTKLRMQQIMEAKLPLIYSYSIQYDPLVNVDYTETYNRNIDNTSQTNDSNTSTASGLTVNSDTPQGQISKSSILSGSYASSTSAGESESSSSGNANGTSNTEENYTKHIKGNSGVSATAQKMIQLYRENIVAINKEIIDELSDIFIGLW